MAGFVLQGEVKDNHTRPIPKYEDAVYGKSTTNYLKSDASSGRHYVDLNAAMKNHHGAWIYGNEHVVTHVGRARAEWEQFVPLPADLRDGVLVKGNVLYRQKDGSWRKSNDLVEGVLRTVHGRHGGRYFVGRTQHSFYGRRFRGGRLRVVAHLNVRMSHRSPSNPLFPVPKRAANSAPQYRRQTYTTPTLTYPQYEQGPLPY